MAWFKSYFIVKFGGKTQNAFNVLDKMSKWTYVFNSGSTWIYIGRRLFGFAFSARNHEHWVHWHQTNLAHIRLTLLGIRHLMSLNFLTEMKFIDLNFEYVEELYKLFHMPRDRLGKFHFSRRCPETKSLD